MLALQRALVRHGYRLPRFGADGHFGAETRAALSRFAKEVRVHWNTANEVNDELLAALGIDDDPDVPEPDEDFDTGDVRVYDFRDDWTGPHPKGREGPGGLTLVRDPREIDSIVLHQTGVDFADRDTDEKTARRAMRVAAHAMAFEGFVSLPAPLLWYINHANNLNRRSLGIEVDGNYPGLVGRKVLHGQPTRLKDETVLAARVGVKLLVTEGRRIGCPVRYIYAHRQADSWRQADPGEELWRRVVLEYAVPVLGLETRPAERYPNRKGPKRHGMPIPAAWDPDGVGKY